MSTVQTRIALKAIQDERFRQIQVEGYDAKHDDKHTDSSLAIAAICYAMAGVPDGFEAHTLARLWPWATEHWKPKSRRRNLEIAGALIAAEIERLDRIDLRVSLQAEKDAKRQAEEDIPNPTGKFGTTAEDLDREKMEEHAAEAREEIVLDDDIADAEE